MTSITFAASSVKLSTATAPGVEGLSGGTKGYESNGRAPSDEKYVNSFEVMTFCTRTFNETVAHFLGVK